MINETNYPHWTDSLHLVATKEGPGLSYAEQLDVFDRLLLDYKIDPTIRNAAGRCLSEEIGYFVSRVKSYEKDRTLLVGENHEMMSRGSARLSERPNLYAYFQMMAKVIELGPQNNPAATAASAASVEAPATAAPNSAPAP